MAFSAGMRPSFEQRARECAYDATFSLTLAYNGASFSGFARQPGQSTVQGEVEAVLSLLLHRPIEVVCAGRTDAGVHAHGQVVSFDVNEGEFCGCSASSFCRSVNALTHEDIVVRKVQRRPRGFSARFDAVEREYRYFLSIGQEPSLFTRDTSWHVGPDVDVDAMREGAACLIGEHDFKSFCKAESAEGKSTTRCVNEVSFFPEDILGEPHLVVKVRGNAFLHSMVRTIVGTLVAVGRGKREPCWVSEVLSARDRRAAGENAPACGLVFWHVAYPRELS